MVKLIVSWKGEAVCLSIRMVRLNDHQKVKLFVPQKHQVKCPPPPKGQVKCPPKRQSCLSPITAIIECPSRKSSCLSIKMVKLDVSFKAIALQWSRQASLCITLHTTWLMLWDRTVWHCFYCSYKGHLFYHSVSTGTPAGTKSGKCLSFCCIFVSFMFVEGGMWW